jgi:type I restriction enzyme M protein
VKGKRQNQLSEEHIAKIIDTYQNRTEAPRYSRRVEMDEPERSGDRLHAVQPAGRAQRVKSRRTTST